MRSLFTHTQVFCMWTLTSLTSAFSWSMNRLISQLFSKLIDSLSKNKSEYSKNYPFQFDKVQGLIFFKSVVSMHIKIKQYTNWYELQFKIIVTMDYSANYLWEKCQKTSIVVSSNVMFCFKCLILSALKPNIITLLSYQTAIFAWNLPKNDESITKRL